MTTAADTYDLTTTTVARLLGVSPDAVATWADDENSGLNCLRTPGGHRRFRRADIDEFIAKRRNAPKDAA